MLFIYQLKKTILFLTSILILITSCKNTNMKNEIEYINPPQPGKAPYTEMVRVNNMLYLSGKVGMDLTGKIVEGGIEAETKQALKNVKEALEKNGSDLDHIIKTTVFLKDMNDFGAMNEIYKTYFSKNYPARSTVSCTLPFGALVEVECIAVIKE